MRVYKIEMNTFDWKKANTELFCSCYDRLKQKNKHIYTNSYKSTNYYSEKFEKKDCKLYIYENSFFIVIPVYDFYEVIYFSSSPEQMSSDAKELLTHLKDYKLKIELVSRKEDDIKELENILFPIGFILRNQTVRFTATKDQKFASNYLEIIKGLIKGIPEDLNNPGLAREDDAERIQHLLLSDFNAIDYNVPELDEIRENAKKGQIVVVRNQDGLVISLRYFTVENNIISNWFDVTDINYRGQLLINLVDYYQLNLFKQQKRRFTRAYGWRNAKNARLIRLSKKNKGTSDGTVITSFFREI